MTAIEVDGISRTFELRSGAFGRRRQVVTAVDSVSFQVQRGELFGLLGPNGAGKTTTIKMLISLLLPTGGGARVLGFDVVGQAKDVRRNIGYVFGGDRGLYSRLSAMDNLKYFAELYAVPHRIRDRRIAELLAVVGLEGREQERVEGYSRGMRQRLHIARGMLHSPAVLFLDEPSIGIDPVGARELRNTVKRLVETGTTVLLTTHYMFEADELCDRIAVINHGRLVVEGTPGQLKSRAGSSGILEVEVFGAVPVGATEKIAALPEVHRVGVEDRDGSQLLTIGTAKGADLEADVLACLDGAPVARIHTRPPTLEDAYVEIIEAS
ncbi:ABC transporter ATP-binding protein [Actinoplanes subglobosus]|uniref:ABC transporter ATP-binding protein n=1 Tax=Actinoplanes subglobosus TaxID=1547892 RepID=A0ABV8IRF6_9ACTN